LKIRVDTQTESLDLTVPVGARLLDYLQEAGIPVNAACGGNATCQKCRVRLRSGFLAPTAGDRKAFRPDELEAGWRLSCQSRPKVNLEVELPAIESFKTKPRVVRFDSVIREVLGGGSRSFGLVCDLGSTGVVLALVDLSSRRVLLEAHLLNRQVRYGADVMTRLHSAQKLGSDPLRKSIAETIEACEQALAAAAGAGTDAAALSEAFASSRKRGIFFAGNSAMTTFAFGWPIETLAVSPFQPFSTDVGEGVLSSGTSIRSLPLLAGFVGGDTVAGILAIERRFLSREDSRKPWMLVDIGTNTEIVLFSPGAYAEDDTLWFSSAPAGPAFEGGNIAQGMRAEPGAISKAQWNGESADGGASGWKFETIGGDRAKGICGSGLIDVLDQAVKGGLITADGYLPGGRLELTPSVSLLADDIREFQLAKSATRSAIDLLIDRAGVRPEKIYFAGTFAANLDLASVFGVGILPAGIPVEPIGNGSLVGTLEFAAMKPAERDEWVARLLRMRRPIELALQDDFQDRFVRNLNF
jgi:uncharacterized 2Fe-2S/4Fe-4S cluster protein (DUF4445 family)